MEFNLPNLDAPAVVLSIAGSLRILGLDKLFFEFWNEIVKVWLKNKVNQQNIVATHQADNVLTYEYAMVVIGYYYSQLSRRIIDIAAVVEDLGFEDENISDYIRVRIAPDVQRVRKILSLTKLSNGKYLAEHIVFFTNDEIRILEFYAPVAKNFNNNSFSEVREIILMQTDKLYSDAEVFFQNK